MRVKLVSLGGSFLKPFRANGFLPAFLSSFAVFFVVLVGEHLEFGSIERGGELGIAKASLLPYLLVGLVTAALVLLLSNLRAKGLEDRLNVLHRLLEKCSKTIQDANQRLNDANQRIENLERHDAQTGVANRRYFAEFLDREWRLAMRMSHPVSLLIVNIDSLNADNPDAKGLMEEEALKRVAEALSKTAKRPGDLAGRLDSKEFGIVLAFTPLEAAMQVAEKLRETIAEFEVDLKDSEQFNNILINVGIATTVPTLGSTPDELIAKADRALNLAKMENKEGNLAVN